MGEEEDEDEDEVEQKKAMTRAGLMGLTVTDRQTGQQRYCRNGIPSSTRIMHRNWADDRCSQSERFSQFNRFHSPDERARNSQELDRNCCYTTAW